jgi:hypothetical protein
MTTMRGTARILAPLVFVACAEAGTLADAGGSSEASDSASSSFAESSTSESEADLGPGTTIADAERSTFCDDHFDAVLCSAFDPPDGIFGWALWVSSYGAGVLVQSDEAYSEPASVESHLDDLDELREARIYQSAQVDASRATIAFAVRVSDDCFTEAGLVELAEIGVTPATGPWVLRLAVDADAVAIRGPYMQDAVRTTTPFAAERWHEIELDLDATAGVASVRIDGIVAAHRLPLPLPTQMHRLQLNLGARREPYERGSCTVHLDDVLVSI